jgi:hypothetical protein
MIRQPVEGHAELLTAHRRAMSGNHDSGSSEASNSTERLASPSPGEVHRRAVHDFFLRDD